MWKNLPTGRMEGVAREASGDPNPISGMVGAVRIELTTSCSQNRRPSAGPRPDNSTL